MRGKSFQSGFVFICKRPAAFVENLGYSNSFTVFVNNRSAENGTGEKAGLFIESRIKYARENGFVTTLMKRRRYIPEINNADPRIRQFAERTAVNTPIQGSAADLIKKAMIDIHAALKEKKFKTKLILQVHDELVFEVPKGELNKLKKLVKEKMEKVLTLKVPISVRIKIGKNWLDMKELD